MKFSLKNRKVGNAVITSRAVGDTCPTSCEFLGNGCYAEKTEKLYPATRKFGLDNIITNKHKLRSMFVHAVKNNLAVRIHERGDFFKNNSLDITYLNDIIAALKSLKQVPTIWCYTHIYDSRILELTQYGVTVYASIHNKKQMDEAKKAGFKLFAFGDINRRLTNKRGKHNPKYIKTLGKNFLVCPEQRVGKRVTCCGNESSTACKYCTTGKGHVLFIR